jgi:hypothetical protein
MLPINNTIIRVEEQKKRVEAIKLKEFLTTAITLDSSISSGALSALMAREARLVIVEGRSFFNKR